MTIRTRLSLWYAGVLTSSLMVIGVWTYHELRRATASHANSREAGNEHAIQETERDWFCKSACRRFCWAWLAAGG